jgi:phosphatidylethanolamine-binding protein (PEBP) family uncharacterized protein
MQFQQKSILAVVVAAALLVSSSYAQVPGGPGPGVRNANSAKERAIDTLGRGIPANLDLTVPGGLTDSAGLILDRYTGRGQGLSPPLRWKAGPSSTKSYVMMLQDPIEENPAGQVNQHWLVYNIPANVTSLPEGIPLGTGINGVPGAVQMPMTRGPGYTSPVPKMDGNFPGGPPGGAGAPPAGGAPPGGVAPPGAQTGAGSNELIRNLGYIFQVFALDTTLNAPVDYDALIAGMKGHVLAYSSLAGDALMPAFFRGRASNAPLGGGAPPPRQ